MDQPAHPTPTTPTDVIALVRGTAAAVRAGEADLLVLATVWADAHPDLEADAENRASLTREPTEVEPDRDPDAPDPRVPRWPGRPGHRSRRPSGSPPVPGRR